MSKNININLFDDATRLKLNIFGKCFKEWLPVFIHDPFTKHVYIYDFFAGSGTDAGGAFGSPLILLNEAKGENKKYCAKADKKITFIFNEGIRKKSLELQKNVTSYINGCCKKNKCNKCAYSYQIKQLDFLTFFKDKDIQSILNNNKYGKFVIIDQYGFKEINDDVFLQLVKFPKTDFIFFISSSFIRRFEEHPNTKLYIDTTRINFNKSQPKECHRVITDYFRKLIPKNMEYYLHSFTIQKEKDRGNYYGLIFGTNHPLGMEKFLKVCWSQDKFSGESNCNIDNDFEEGTLFYNPSNSNKIDKMRQEIKENILSKKITDNISGLKFALQKGCEPILFTQTVKKLEEKNKIIRSGELNYSSSNIHKVKKYYIEVCDNENN